MRDIKFRVWDKETKHMHICGEDVHDTINFEIETNRAYYYNLQNGCGSLREDSDYVLMQYTGLKDKNGKEIYEGDIVKVKLYKGEEEKYFIGKVEYFGSNFIVDADNNSEYHVYDLDGFGIDYRYNLEDCEVIGNIYDNLELLEEGEKK